MASAVSNQVKAKIVNLYETGEYTMMQLANKFGVSQTTVFRAVRDAEEAERVEPIALTITDVKRLSDSRILAIQKDSKLGRLSNAQIAKLHNVTLGVVEATRGIIFHDNGGSSTVSKRYDTPPVAIPTSEKNSIESANSRLTTPFGSLGNSKTDRDHLEQLTLQEIRRIKADFYDGRSAEEVAQRNKVTVAVASAANIVLSLRDPESVLLVRYLTSLGINTVEDFAHHVTK